VSLCVARPRLDQAEGRGNRGTPVCGFMMCSYSRGLSRSRPFYVLSLCLLMCEPCFGWWGKERPSAGTISMEGAKTKALQSWKAANETYEASVESAAKADSMERAALETEAAVDKGKGSMLNVFGRKATPEQQQALAFAAKEARALGPVSKENEKEKRRMREREKDGERERERERDVHKRACKERILLQNLSLLFCIWQTLQLCLLFSDAVQHPSDMM